MDVYSLKMVDIVALTAIVLSLTCPASKSTHIVKAIAMHGKFCKSAWSDVIFWSYFLSPLAYLGLGNSVVFPEILGLSGNTVCSLNLSVALPHFIFAAGAVDIAHNATITLVCRGRNSYPSWYMNGSVVPPGPLYQFEYDPNTGDFLGILKIDGNETCGSMNVSCRVEGQTVYTERLNIEGL